MPNPLHRALRRSVPRAVAATIAVGAGASAAPATASSAPRVDARERSVVDRLNAVRAHHGLAPLTGGRALSRAADRHTRRMLARRTLSHQLPGEVAVGRRLRRAASASTVGETVFYGSGSVRAADVVRAWMDSPPHRALLLSPQFRKAGIGIRRGPGGLYATVDLAG